MSYKLFVLKPLVQMTAQVNQASFTYPLAEVTMDNVSTVFDVGGDWQFVAPEYTVLFGTAAGDDTYGRQRVRLQATATTLYIGRSPRGRRDGEVDLVDNAWITVYSNDLRAWSKIPYIDASTDPPTIYKDHNLAASTNVTDPPPVANAGAWFAGTVGAGGTIRVTLPHETNSSFAVDDGATLSTYTWELPQNATLVSTEGPVGATVYDSNKVDAQRITVDHAYGFALYRLVVTDSNGTEHESHVGVYGYSESAGDVQFIEEFQIVEHRHTPAGQRLSLRILEDLDAEDYPDGTIVMLWNGEPADEEDRSHMEFVGWHQSDPARIVSSREGLRKEITLHCVDIAGRLDILHGFPFTVTSDNSVLTGWYYMPTADWFKFLHYHLQWHTNALICADWKPDKTNLVNYEFVIRTTDGKSVYKQVHEQCQAVVPDYHFTCNRLGQLLVVVDPLLQDSGDRTATVQTTLTESDWSDISYETHHWPRYNWIREEAVLAGLTNVSALFSIAPGDSPGQGSGDLPHGTQIALSQADLNTSAGNRYGRVNAYLGPLTIRLVGAGRRSIDPAEMEWVQLDVGAAYAAQRGLTFSSDRLLPLELRFTYRHSREGTVRNVTLIAEQETVGLEGVTDTSRSEV